MLSSIDKIIRRPIQNLKIVDGSDSSGTGHKNQLWPVFISSPEQMHIMIVNFDIFHIINV